MPSDAKKIAILGTTPSRMEAPIADPSWEIWTIGPGGKDAHRWDRLYETHTVWPADFAAYLNDLSNVKRPQVVRTIVPMKVRMDHWARRWSEGSEEKYAELKAKITGDWEAEELIDRDDLFERHRKMWFSTSICYAIAEAMDLQPKTIGLFGIDLESDEEHISQFIGAAHLLDICRLIGIDIIMPAGSGLERDLNPYPDRYETHLALTYEKKLKLLNGLRGQIEADMEGKRMMLHRTEGALMKLQEIAGVIAGMGATPEMVKVFEDQLAAGNAQLPQLQTEFLAMRDRSNQLNGEKNATEFYQRMFTWGMFDPGRQA